MVKIPPFFQGIFISQQTLLPSKCSPFPCQEYIPAKTIATKADSITPTGVFSAPRFLIIVNGDGALQTSPIFATDLKFYYINPQHLLLT